MLRGVVGTSNNVYRLPETLSPPGRIRIWREREKKKRTINEQCDKICAPILLFCLFYFSVWHCLYGHSHFHYIIVCLQQYFSRLNAIIRVFFSNVRLVFFRLLLLVVVVVCACACFDYFTSKSFILFLQWCAFHCVRGGIPKKKKIANDKKKQRTFQNSEVLQQ